MVLDARGADDTLRELIDHNYHYHEWPALKLEWGHDADYAAAFAGSDIVIFDSSRRHLTSVGLTEDSADDWSAFTDALIDPLMLAGIATVVLDNTGHTDTHRARGSSAKADLADVMFSLTTGEKFGVTRPGRVELTVTHSRIGEVDGTWLLELGAGHYGSWSRRTGGDARDAFEQACIAALTEHGTLGRDALLKDVRARGAGGKTATLRGWLDELLGKPASPVIHDPEIGYRLTPGPDSGPGWARGSSGTLAPDPSFKGGRANPPGPATGPSPSCTCVDGGAEPTADGRCSRCQGVIAT